MKTIVVCGTNGSGKTTLAKMLARSLDYTYVHSIKIDNIDDAIIDSMYQVKECDKRIHHVKDRVQCISAPIYNDMSVEQMLKLRADAVAMSKSSIIVHCTGKGDHDTGKEHYDKELVAQCKNEAESIRRAYYSSMYHLKHIEYDFKVEDYNLFLKRCLQLM